MTSLMYCKVNESTKQQHQQLPQTMTNNGREIATAYKANLVPVFSLLCAVYFSFVAVTALFTGQ